MACATVRRKGLVTIGREPTVFHLQAYQAIKVTEFGVPRFHPQITASVFEHGARHGVGEFCVGVIGLAVLAFKALNQAAKISDFTFKGKAIRLHANVDVGLGHRAVVAAVATDRSAHIPLVKEKGGTQRSAADLAG